MDSDKQNELTSERDLESRSFLESRRPRRKYFILAAALVLFFSTAAFWYWFNFSAPYGFAGNLPADVSFYAAIDLPNKLIDQWPGQPPVVKEALAQFKNRLEISRLPDGNFLAKTKLRDQAAWELFAARHAEIKWQVIGRDVYLSNQPDIVKYLNSKNPSLANTLKRAKVGRGAAVAWLANGDWLNEFPVYKNLTIGLHWPVGIVARDYGDYWQWSFGNPVNAKRLSVAKLPANQTDLSLSINNFSKIIGSEWWLAAGKEFPELAKALPVFYGLDMASFGEKLAGHYSAGLDFAGKNWLVKIRPLAGQGQTDIIEPIKQAAVSWFSQTHPLSVEHTLADGSNMIELRVDSQGLEWQTENDSLFLRGQGEEQGIYIKTQPDGNILLSNSGFFGQFTISDKAPAVCLAPVGSILNSLIKTGNNFIPRVTAVVDNEDNLHLCTFFR